MAVCVPKAIKSSAEMLRPGQDIVFTSQAKRPLFAVSSTNGCNTQLIADRDQPVADKYRSGRC